MPVLYNTNPFFDTEVTLHFYQDGDSMVRYQSPSHIEWLFAHQSQIIYIPNRMTFQEFDQFQSDISNHPYANIISITHGLVMRDGDTVTLELGLHWAIDRSFGG